MKNLSAWFAFSTYLFLSACGGDGASNTPEQITEPDFSGVESSAAISQINGKQLVDALFALNRVNPVLRGLSVNANVNNNVQVAPSFAKSLTPLASSIVFGISGTKTITETLNADNTGTISITFDQFNSGTSVTNGEMTLRIIAFDSMRQAPSLLETSFTNLVTTIGARELRFQGNILQQSDLFNRSLTFNLSFRDSVAGYSVLADNLIFTVSNNLSETISGRLYHSTIGFVDISTTTALQYSSGWDIQQFPDGGGPVVFASEDGSKLRFTPNANFVAIQFDENGDGTFEKSANYNW